MRFAHTPFPGADTTVCIQGEEYACASGAYWVPPRAERSGRITMRGKTLAHAPSRLLYQRIGWLRREDTGAYTAVYRLRIVPIIALAAIAVCACTGIALALNSGTGSADNGPSATGATAPAYIDSETTTAHQTEVKGAAVSYAAYESVSDQQWKVGVLEQSIRLALPGSVIDADGHTAKNPVDAAPHIYVDLNGDGEFSADECVYNPMTYADDGSVSDYGKFLRAGTEVNSIALTQTLPAGDYNAELVWTSVMASDHTPANPMSFNFKISVS